MAQLFSPRANVHSRVIIVGIVVLVCGVGWATSAIYWSPYTTDVGVPFDQPVPFSHKHHVGDDGIDCRYCHTSVERSAFAGLPSTQTCMTCHSQLFSDAQVLAAVRESLSTSIPLPLAQTIASKLGIKAPAPTNIKNADWIDALA